MCGSSSNGPRTVLDAIAPLFVEGTLAPGGCEGATVLGAAFCSSKKTQGSNNYYVTPQTCIIMAFVAFQDNPLCTVGLDLPLAAGTLISMLMGVRGVICKCLAAGL